MPSTSHYTYLRIDPLRAFVPSPKPPGMLLSLNAVLWPEPDIANGCPWLAARMPWFDRCLCSRKVGTTTSWLRRPSMVGSDLVVEL